MMKRPLLEDTVAMRARQVELPEEIRALDTLADPSYTFACEVTASPTDGRSAEQWARAVQEDMPWLLRWFILTGWIVGLGLRLGPRPSPSHIQGWKILSATSTAIVFGVESFFLRAHLVVQVQDSHVIHATFVRYERRPARIVWAVAEPIHRLVIRYLLGRAATHPAGIQVRGEISDRR